MALRSPGFDLEKRPYVKSDREGSEPHRSRSRFRDVALSLLAVIFLGILAFDKAHALFAWSRRVGRSCHVVNDLGKPAGAIGKVSLNSRTPTTVSTAATASATVLKNFEVAQPVLMPYGAAESDGSHHPCTGGGSASEPCTVLLMRHDFAFSYGQPFVGSYTPPTCQFNRVVMNLTVVTEGRQYDRLAIMYFGDTEVWRTSTAEPTPRPGISWTYLKDTTAYLSLWKQPQKVIFDLGNLVNDKYTGIFNTTLTATFFMADVAEPNTAPPADRIIPISTRQSGNDSVSQFTIPLQNATNTITDFPRNAQRAVFSISACGQANEEFWWSNVFNSDVLAFNSTAGPLPGFSPFREVQLLIDRQLAGVQWPFPVIFTGGVVPGLHRPIAGIDAFDLKEHEIDITPFLPLLCDGKEHTFTIRVAGLDDSWSGKLAVTETVGDTWFVTGKIFIWLNDDSSAITTGAMPIAKEERLQMSISHSLTQSANGTNETLTYDTTVQRRLTIAGRVGDNAVSWSQTLSYTNKGFVSDYGFSQVNDMSIAGTDRASSVAAAGAYYSSEYSYPLFANQSYSVSKQGNMTICTYVKQGKQVDTYGAQRWTLGKLGGMFRGGVFPTGLEAFAFMTDGKDMWSRIATTKEGSARYYQTGDQKNSTSFGNAKQVFRLTGVSNDRMITGRPVFELYFRNVSAVNSSVVYDHAYLAGTGTEDSGAEATVAEEAGQAVFAPAPEGARGARAFMGRNAGAI
ncbi:hypothetical protein QBC46DRAFT_109029 [Diplogelasinospora grovesii]|uniref:Peptide N-acetyl-beta-D-glucosaminyl asparaginase amidase A N-terminal domain-containing protein n=1 Tax=Diplogelasinospora grovesii TaxID=303347 RepID=A0AAN6MWN5_9PEZI|nr:hypothetical protein QBC46DRAFT_109029 [Diplogelasinospora grovesii]